jgi:hypothetical protein
MGLLERLRGSEHRELSQKFAEIRDQTHERARRQSYQLRIEITSEARKIGLSCGIQKKKEFPQYKDIVIMLLANYPPELITFIVTQFDQFTPSLGYAPFGKIYLAMEHLDEISTPVLARVSFLRENPQLMEFIHKSPARTQKAAKTLAAAMCSMVRIEDARETFRILTNPQIKELVRKELLAVDQRVGQYITR